jgi:hypothetical protein
VAENSKRERVLVALVAVVDAITSLNSTSREQPADPKELASIPITKLPMAVITAGLPVPDENDMQRPGAGLGSARSTMDVNIIVYGQYGVAGAGAQNPDTVISNIADDLWRALQATPNLGFKWVSKMNVRPTPTKAVFRPYFAFSMTAAITYVHDKGGI